MSKRKTHVLYGETTEMGLQKGRSCNASSYFEWQENTHLEQTEEHL